MSDSDIVKGLEDAVSKCGPRLDCALVDGTLLRDALERLRASRASDPEAMKAARRIVDACEKSAYYNMLGDPRYPDAHRKHPWFGDPLTVSYAYLAPLASAASRAAVWAECREACAKVIEDHYWDSTGEVGKAHGASLAKMMRALEVPNE